MERTSLPETSPSERLLFDTWARARPVGDGWTRRQPLRAALIAATLVTLATAGPLAVLALRADSPVDPVEVILEGRVRDISGEEIRADEVLMVDAGEFDGAAWLLFVRDGARIGGGQSTNGASLQIDLGRLGLVPGEYDLFVSGTRSDGETVLRASRFVVVDEA